MVDNTSLIYSFPDAASLETMPELRAVIDQVDCAVVGLLAHRQALIERAAEIKFVAKLPAHIPERVTEVIAHVRGEADRVGVPPELAEQLWHILIDWSIKREAERLGKFSPTKTLKTESHSFHPEPGR